MDQANVVASSLGVDPSIVAQWVERGMPLELDQAEQWLVDQGLAEFEDAPAPAVEVGDVILKTRNDIAALLRVAPTVAGVLVKEPDFPSPWSRKAILRWHEERGPASLFKSSTKEERDKIKLELERLKLDKERGEVLGLEDVIAEMTRQHSLAVQKLKNLVNLLITILPSDTPALIVEDFRARARKVIADACDDLATAFRGGTDDSE